MANKENEALDDGESEGDTLSSLKVITSDSTKTTSRRTFSTSEIDREEKTSAKIVTEFLTRSPVINSLVILTRHAPLPHRTEASNKDIPVQQTAEMNLNAVCKKKMSDKLRPQTEYYSPPVRNRDKPSNFPPTSRPRSRSLPASDEQHSMRKYLTDEEECVAKLVGSRLSDIANRINPNVSCQVIERIMFEVISTTISQTGYRRVPVEAFRQALEMVRRKTSCWTHHSILDMLFYGRKMFSHFLINFEGSDINELKLIDQFVDFFNIHCLPWIRSHGGWGKVLHHTKEGDPTSTVDASCEGDRAFAGQLPVEELDGRTSVTPTVFSSDSDEESSTLEPVLPPLSQPVRQLSNIPETENTEMPDPSNTETVSTSMPPADQHEHDSTTTTTTTSSGSNILHYGTTIAVAGAMIYTKLNY